MSFVSLAHNGQSYVECDRNWDYLSEFQCSQILLFWFYIFAIKPN